MLIVNWVTLCTIEQNPSQRTYHFTAMGWICMWKHFMLYHPLVVFQHCTICATHNSISPIIMTATQPNAIVCTGILCESFSSPRNWNIKSNTQLRPTWSNGSTHSTWKRFEQHIHLAWVGMCVMCVCCVELVSFCICAHSNFNWLHAEYVCTFCAVQQIWANIYMCASMFCAQ